MRKEEMYLLDTRVRKAERFTGGGEILSPLVLFE